MRGLNLSLINNLRDFAIDCCPIHLGVTLRVKRAYRVPIGGEPWFRSSRIFLCRASYK